MWLRYIPLFLAAATAVAFGEEPVISSVQNAASMTELPVIAPQMLVAITGQNLATVATGASYPWRTQLAGTSVTFNAVPATLSYVSPSQINALVPSALQSATSATIVVTTDVGVSEPLIATVAASSVGIFTQDMSGCGQLSAYNIHSDGSMSLNTPQNRPRPDRRLWFGDLAHRTRSISRSGRWCALAIQPIGQPGEKRGFDFQPELAPRHSEYPEYLFDTGADGGHLRWTRSWTLRSRPSECNIC
jgi:IPT/TIG domain-containing protein